MKSRARKKQNELIVRIVLGVSGALVLASLVALIAQYVASLPGSHRMEDFDDVPKESYEDLLYLTYIDSLRLDELAVPPAADDSTDIALLVLEEAGVSRETIAAWGFVHETLNDLYVGMHELGRLKRPGEAGVLKLIRQKEISAGHIILGQLHPYTHNGVINFSGIITRSNTFGPVHSTILYRHGARIVHGKLGEAPRFAYFGTVVPGYDLARTYREHLLVKRRLK